MSNWEALQKQMKSMKDKSRTSPFKKGFKRSTKVNATKTSSDKTKKLKNKAAKVNLEQEQDGKAAMKKTTTTVNEVSQNDSPERSDVITAVEEATTVASTNESSLKRKAPEDGKGKCSKQKKETKTTTQDHKAKSPKLSPKLVAEEKKETAHAVVKDGGEDDDTRKKIKITEKSPEMGSGGATERRDKPVTKKARKGLTGDQKKRHRKTSSNN